ncbi:MAG: hypothetical protein KC425_18130 [Anaerolineales bacterium]|nr:hypothetical protein [Anaerolineales bacterium]
MTHTPKTPARTDWQALLETLRAELETLQSQLIESEARLAERLAAINAFEFQLRARLGALSDRLDALQKEIAAYRRRLRQMQEDWFFGVDGGENGRFQPDDWNFAEDAGAAAQGAYRYMGARLETPAETLSQDKQEELKKLYRQLARRFHPDFARDDADRHYRTQLMMQINAAYAAGDLAQLRQLAAEPDSLAGLDAAQSAEQLVETLQQEIARCRRRLQEIEAEFRQLEQHRSTRLLRRVERARENGRDLLADMEAELRERIAHKLVERDVLLEEIDAFGDEEPEVADDSFADTMFDLQLEQVFEEDPDLAAYDWHSRRSSKFWHDDDDLDDLDDLDEDD